MALKDEFSHESELNEAQNKKAHYLIIKTNYKRSRVLFGLTLIIECMLIIVFDLETILSGDLLGLTAKHQYMYIHVLLFLVSTLLFIMSKRTFPKELDNKFHFHHIVMWTLIVVFMSGVAYIAGLDQLITDQILSFVVVVLIGGFFALVRPPFQIFILGIPCLVFIFSILKFQPDLEVATFNIANGIIFMVTMAIVSSSIYKSTFNQYSRDILLRARNEQLEFFSTS